MVIQDFVQATVKLVELFKNSWVFRCFAAIHAKSCIAFILGHDFKNFQQTNKQPNNQPTNNQWNANNQPTNQPVRPGVKANPQKCAALHVAPPWRPPARWSKRRVTGALQSRRFVRVGFSGENWKKVEGNQVTYPRGAKISCFLFEMFKVF